MKKKGLIIATIVMVLVLAVSLTTATYAWFTATASTTVDQITLSAVVANGLLIGAKGAASPSHYDDYRTGEVVWDASNSVWTGTETGLGQNVSMNIVDPNNSSETIKMAVGSSQAVSYTTTAITATGSGTSITANNWYKGNGNGATLDKGTIGYALPNADYVDLELGITAAQNDKVKQAWLTIAVTLPTGQSKLGMAAAIHFIVYIDGVSTVGTEFDGLSAYPGKSYSNNYAGSVSSGTYAATAIATTNVGIGNQTLSQYGWAYVVPIYDSATAMASMTTIKTVRVIAWIEGTDDACVVANAGTGGNIDLLFSYAEAQDYKWSNGVMSANA